jgi:hypothetical protein
MNFGIFEFTKKWTKHTQKRFKSRKFGVKNWVYTAENWDTFTDPLNLKLTAWYSIFNTIDVVIYFGIEIYLTIIWSEIVPDGKKNKLGSWKLTSLLRQMVEQCDKMQ